MFCKWFKTLDGKELRYDTNILNVLLLPIIGTSLL